MTDNNNIKEPVEKDLLKDDSIEETEDEFRQETHLLNLAQRLKDIEGFTREKTREILLKERGNFPENEIQGIIECIYRPNGIKRELILKTDKGKIKIDKEKAIDYLMFLYYFLTTKDDEELLVYKDGVYVLEGEVVIKETLEEVLQSILSTYDLKEIINHIKRRTYIDRSEFNKDKEWLNLKNGLLNWKTKEFKPSTSNFRSTIQLPIEYDSEATCPTISKFFKEILDENDVALVEEIFGYCLIPDNAQQKSFLLIGEGTNGKSTLINLLRRSIGEKNCASVDLQQLEHNRFAASNLFGKLINTYADLSPQVLKKTGLFKSITGEDFLSAERKFRDQFQFKPFTRLIFSANQLPEPIYDRSDAFFRRWILINFPNCFEGKEDKHLLDKLTTPEELSGLLNLALGGLERLHSNGGFSYRLSTDEIRKRYLELSSPVIAFVKDCCELILDGEVTKGELYNNFADYSEKKHLPKYTKRRFHDELIREYHLEEGMTRMGEENKMSRTWKGIISLGSAGKTPEQRKLDEKIGDD
jgi:putative DNA primase/helicase